MLKMVDLFAGTGAFTLAFENSGKVEVVFANDNSKISKEIYDANFGEKSCCLTLNDLDKIENENIPPHNILTAGFPCQPFSIAGKQEGFDDDRANVFWKIMSVVDHHKPECVILENVKNLLTHNKKKTFEIIKENLQSRGYHICHKVLNTAEITGIPQHRERVYIVCLKSKEAFDSFNLDFPTIHKTPIQDFFEDDIPSNYYYTEKSIIFPLLQEKVTNRTTLYQYRRYYVRENKSNECPTLTCNMGTGGHNVPILLNDIGIRKLTPRECFNFQGFPSSYELPSKISNTSLYKLAGNAVSFPVVELIAQRIIPLLL
jgi:DNA (cytosine-5)-methyltransferase 1